jgi:hypothetical protein
MTAADEGPSTEPAVSARAAETPRRASFGKAISRYFLMREALEEAKAGHFKQTDPGFAAYLSAQRCLEAGLGLGQDVWLKLEGVVLLRHAFPMALTAWQSRQGLGVDEDLPKLWRAFADHPVGKQLTSKLSRTAVQLIEQFVNAHDTFYFASLSEQDLATLGNSLFGLTGEVIRGLAADASALQQLRAIRIFRTLVAPLAVAVLAYVGDWWSDRPVNWALNQPVQLSSAFEPTTYPAQALVNGDTQTLGIHTMSTESPWAQIDLGEVRRIRRVVVFNRRNIRTNSAPLQIDTSVDGSTFERFAYNDASEFLEWTAEGPRTEARYVRLTVPRLSSLQLCEVEVY